MKALILTAAAALLSVTAHAAPTTSLECHFTEPFFSLNVDLLKKEISRTEPDWENGGQGTVTKVIHSDIELKADLSDVLAPKYKLVTAKGDVIADLELNMKGSDGMSDILYPFEVKYADMWGGCQSDVIKRFEPNY